MCIRDRFLKHSLTQAVQWGLLTENPLRGLALPVRVANERVRYLLPAEYQRLLAVCPLPWRRVVTLAVHTGLRRTELITLQWVRVDMANRMIVFPGAGRKTGRPHSVELSDVAYETLLEIQAEHAAHQVTPAQVFYDVARGRSLRPKDDRWWYRACREAGLHDFRFHDLRHTTASWLRMTGADLLTVKEILGHSSIKMTARYAHITPVHRKAALNRFSDLIPEAEDRSKTVDSP